MFPPVAPTFEIFTYSTEESNPKLLSLNASPACGVLKRHNFGVHVSLGSVETLVRRGGIINHHSIAYSLSNISAKNYRNRLMWAESTVCNISVVFLRHSVYSRHKRFKIFVVVATEVLMTFLNPSFIT